MININPTLNLSLMPMNLNSTSPFAKLTLSFPNINKLSKKPTKTMTYKNNSKKFKTTSKKKNNGLIFNFKSTKNLSNKRNQKLPIKPTEKSGNIKLKSKIYEVESKHCPEPLIK